jgi:hypothetical protein
LLVGVELEQPEQTLVVGVVLEDLELAQDFLLPQAQPIRLLLAVVVAQIHLVQIQQLAP